MRSLPEFLLYQGILDNLDFGWLPETYYTLAYGEKFPSFEVSRELMDAMEPFVGQPINDLTKHQAQCAVDIILREREIRREILIWSNADSRPLLIDTAKIVQSGDYTYSVRPYRDRTAIMAGVIEKLEKEHG